MSWACRAARILRSKRKGRKGYVSKARSQKKTDSLAGVLGMYSIVKWRGRKNGFGNMD